jgi:hypothetical protein
MGGFQREKQIAGLLQKDLLECTVSTQRPPIYCSFLDFKGAIMAKKKTK